MVADKPEIPIVSDALKADEMQSSKLSSEQVTALSQYKKGSDQEINQALRLQKAEASTIEKIGNLDSIFDDAKPTNETIVVYRGFKFGENDDFAR